ncbi:MAG: NAD-dependent dehydratase, partial [Desulfovibrionaceae bacterium]
GDTVALIAEVMGADISITCEAERLRPKGSEVERLFAGNAKIRERAGWTPEFGGLDGFQRGLERTVAWFSVPENVRGYKADIYNL